VPDRAPPLAGADVPHALVSELRIRLVGESFCERVLLILIFLILFIERGGGGALRPDLGLELDVAILLRDVDNPAPLEVFPPQAVVFFLTLLVQLISVIDLKP
jgi:hypothetical protein